MGRGTLTITATESGILPQAMYHSGLEQAATYLSQEIGAALARIR